MWFLLFDRPRLMTHTYMSCSRLCRVIIKELRNCGEWFQDTMVKALDAVKNGMNYKQASRQFAASLLSRIPTWRQQQHIELNRG